MAPHEFKDLLDKYAQGKCTRSEEEFILAWYDKIATGHQDELREEYRVVVEAKLWSRLQERIIKSRDEGFAWRKMAAAVIIFLVAGAAVFIFTGRFSDTTTSVGDQSQALDVSGKMVSVKNNNFVAQVIKLNDGSEVTLQPQSEIQFPAAFGSEREVYLKGEAFFNVKRDPSHPFLVYSNEVVTRVLGTSFTVKAYADMKNITVAVKTGRVSVYKNLTQEGDSQKEEVILTPNQQAVYDRLKNEVSRHLVSKPEIINHLAKEPSMQYDGAQVVEIFDELEKMYGVEIDFDSEVLENCTLTTSMKEEGLFERIKVICEAIGARYEVQNTSILIKSEGCNN